MSFGSMDLDQNRFIFNSEVQGAMICKSSLCGLPLSPPPRSGRSNCSIGSTSATSADDGSSCGCSSPGDWSEVAEVAPQAEEYSVPPPPQACFSQQRPLRALIRPPPGLAPPDKQPKPAPARFIISRGSKNHAKGQCRPCVACRTPEGCPRGELCNFCHYEHDEAKMTEAALFSAKARLRRLGAGQAPPHAAVPSAADVWDSQPRAPAPAAQDSQPRAPAPAAQGAADEPWYVSTAAPVAAPVPGQVVYLRHFTF